MAFRPCVSCGRGFRGGSVFTYLTWFIGDDRKRVRMVQCTECASELRNGVLEVGDAWADDDWAAVQALVVPTAAGAGRNGKS